MIGRLSGILLEKNPPQLLVDCQGVGYEVDVPMSTFYNLPHVGEKVVLFTHQAIREDAHLLFGFGNAAERAVFRQLIKITGVGARMALSILSGMTLPTWRKRSPCRIRAAWSECPASARRRPNVCCWN